MKTLILTAALSVAGLASSQAQVFSSNAVGYVNLTMTAGVFNLITNPLDADDNSVSGILSDLPNGSQVLKWNGAGFDANSLGFTGWSDPAMEILPGEGAFVFPGGSGEVVITFVGEVMQGTGTNPLTNELAAGFNLVGSQVPQAGTVTELDLADDLANGSQILKWNGAGYDAFSLGFTGWAPSEPTAEVGEGFFVSVNADSIWSRDFSIN